MALHSTQFFCAVAVVSISTNFECVDVSHHIDQFQSNLVIHDSAADFATRRLRFLPHGYGKSSDTSLKKSIRILHVTDSHISLRDSEAPLSTRMFRAFDQQRARKYFVQILQKAVADDVDLIAMGGDIVNFPSDEDVAWILDKMRTVAPGVPYIYTAGNHDWHLEGKPGDTEYDSQRKPGLRTTLLPFFSYSVAGLPSLHDSERRGLGRLYGLTQVGGVDVIFFDNSNYQIDPEQLEFARAELSSDAKRATPAVILLHIPLALPGMSLPPKLTCGDPAWGARVDLLWKTEGRPRWPETNKRSTMDFLHLVQENAAPAGRIIALLTGHTHEEEVHDIPVMGRNHIAILACPHQNEGCWSSSNGTAPGFAMVARGAVQYTTDAALTGGSRLLTVRRGAASEFESGDDLEASSDNFYRSGSLVVLTSAVCALLHFCRDKARRVSDTPDTPPLYVDLGEMQSTGMRYAS